LKNIFEHNISKDEIDKLDKMTPGRKITNKKNYLKSISKDISYADLYRLYLVRGEKQIAQKYLNKIKDQTLKYFLEN
jgi:hypothetical protein